MEGTIRGVSVHQLGNVTCCLTNTSIPLVEPKVLAVGHDGASKCFRQKVFFDRLNPLRLNTRAQMMAELRRQKKAVPEDVQNMSWETFLPGLVQSGPHYTLDIDEFGQKMGRRLTTQFVKEFSDALGTPALTELFSKYVTVEKAKNPPPKAKKARRPKKVLASGRL